MGANFIPHPSCTVTSGDCFREARCIAGCKKTVARAKYPLPTEPTPEMVWAGNSLLGYDRENTTAADVWRAMAKAHTKERRNG